MTEFKTAAYYHTLAKKLAYPTDAFIDGKFCPSISGQTFVSYNPATGEELAKIASCQSEDVDIAVKAARKAFDAGIWCKCAPVERKAVLLNFADHL